MDLYVGIGGSTVNVRISLAAHAFAIGMFMAIVVAVTAGTNAALPNLSNSGGGNWSNFREITITNTGGSLTDYQVLVQLSSANFPINARPDGADIRFTDVNEKELSYWIENWYFSGKTANVWVKVISIPAGVTTIRMYYGNPSASSASNGATTFDFFDDFNSLTWQQFGNASQVSTSEGKSVVTITGWGEIVSPISLQSPNYAFASMSKLTSGMVAYMPFFGFGPSDRAGDEDNAYQFGYNVYFNCFCDNIRIMKNTAWVANQNGDIAHTGRTEWTKTEFMVYDGTLTQKVDDSSKGIQQIVLTDTGNWVGQIPKEIGIIVWNSNTYSAYAVDWVLIRKYTSPDPALAIGAEQILPTLTSTLTSTPTPTPTPSPSPSPTPTPIITVTPTPIITVTPTPTVTVTSTPTSGLTPTPTTSPSPITGSISISSIPTGASIYIDENYQGTTPKNLTDIAAGSHSITLNLTGYQDWSQTINVAADQPSSVSPELAPALPESTTPVPTAPPSPDLSNLYPYGIVIIAIVLIAIAALKRRGSYQETKPIETETVKRPEPSVRPEPEPVKETKQPPIPEDEQKLHKCPNCGAEVHSGDRFCEECGEPLGS